MDISDLAFELDVVGLVQAETLEVELVGPSLDQHIHAILVRQDLLNVVRIFSVDELILECLVALVLDSEQVQIRFIFLQHNEAAFIDELDTACGVVELVSLRLVADYSDNLDVVAAVHQNRDYALDSRGLLHDEKLIHLLILVVQLDTTNLLVADFFPLVLIVVRELAVADLLRAHEVLLLGLFQPANVCLDVEPEKDLIRISLHQEVQTAIAAEIETHYLTVLILLLFVLYFVVDDLVLVRYGAQNNMVIIRAVGIKGPAERRQALTVSISKHRCPVTGALHLPAHHFLVVANAHNSQHVTAISFKLKHLVDHDVA